MDKYTLIVTEKPDAANRIAIALDENGKPKKSVNSGVPYYQAYRDGNIVVVPALGHLYTVTSKEKGYPVFDYKWVPRYQAERGASHIRTWLKVIGQLARDAKNFVDACDFDVEGSIIGYTILKY
ncbi:MAG TPA: toprim domain-containing protein, partial [Candidatus Sulfotelmatobacter sp.]|nr:toprim domain-containing protein [Candidatus Sulfotelmatobacter sp.]